MIRPPRSSLYCMYICPPSRPSPKGRIRKSRVVSLQETRNDTTLRTVMKSMKSKNAALLRAPAATRHRAVLQPAGCYIYNKAIYSSRLGHLPGCEAIAHTRCHTHVGILNVLTSARTRRQCGGTVPQRPLCEAYLNNKERSPRENNLAEKLSKSDH